MGFSETFLWGAASAAAQVEGAYHEDGRTDSIWDVLADGHIAHGETCHEATDHYHHHAEDVALMKKIGLKSYRFSISWSRVQPAEGVTNAKGLAFYSTLVDELLEAGIEPLVTLFHWDLPMWVFEKGGWENPEVGTYFEAYVQVVVEALSDRVKYFMTLNEPQLFIGGGYVTGFHAPFYQKPELTGKLMRNVLVANGMAIKTIRQTAKQKVFVGMAPTGSGIVPKEMTKEAVERARNLSYPEDGGPWSTNGWMDPVILGTVPKSMEGAVTEADMNVIHQPLDFFGYNIYNSVNGMLETTAPDFDTVVGEPRTAMDWPVTPECLYWMTKFHYERYHLPVLITENGMAGYDWVSLDGAVHDPARIDFMHRYLLQLKRAVDEGIPVLGYQYWSVMDNFEWTLGYDKRFGLIHVDFSTGKRTLKDSCAFYAEVIRTNGECL